MRWRRAAFVVHSHVVRWHGSDRLRTRGSRSSSTCRGCAVIVSSTRALPRDLGDRRVGCDDRTARAFIRSRGGSTARQGRRRRRHGSRIGLGSRRARKSFRFLLLGLFAIHVGADLGKECQRVSILLITFLGSFIRWRRSLGTFFPRWLPRSRTVCRRLEDLPMKCDRQSTSRRGRGTLGVSLFRGRVRTRRSAHEILSTRTSSSTMRIGSGRT